MPTSDLHKELDIARLALDRLPDQRSQRALRSYIREMEDQVLLHAPRPTVVDDAGGTLVERA
jgi:hypothetical protein